MKRFIQCISILLVVVLLSSPVLAAESVGAKASDYFMSYTAYLYKTSGTQFQVWFDVTAVGTMDQLGASSIKVQRSSDGSNWTTMKTYYSSSYSQLIAYNTFTHDDCVTYTGTSGYYYRACVTLYAKKGSGSASRTIYTSSLYFPAPQT